MFFDKALNKKIISLFIFRKAMYNGAHTNIMTAK